MVPARTSLIILFIPTFFGVNIKNKSINEMINDTNFLYHSEYGYKFKSSEIVLV